jgi:hypothetical protein
MPSLCVTSVIVFSPTAQQVPSSLIARAAAAASEPSITRHHSHKLCVQHTPQRCCDHTLTARVPPPTLPSRINAPIPMTGSTILHHSPSPITPTNHRPANLSSFFGCDAVQLVGDSQEPAVEALERVRVCWSGVHAGTSALTWPRKFEELGPIRVREFEEIRKHLGAPPLKG